jgi:cob(I)alamin adenosyltransferase
MENSEPIEAVLMAAENRVFRLQTDLLILQTAQLVRQHKELEHLRGRISALEAKLA